MLIDITDIQAIRSVANNIDRQKIDIYIREAERLDLIPIIGMDLYTHLTSDKDFIVIKLDKGGVPILLADENGDLIYDDREQTTAEALMLNGGEYYGCCGKLRSIEGLKVALAYFAYARLVTNHQVAVTPFGVVTKMGDDSNPTSQETIASVVNDARNIGKAILARCMTFWGDVERCFCVSYTQIALSGNGKKKFISIGD